MSKHTNIITGVLGLAINQNGQYLLTLRNEPKYQNTHKHWQVPGGGMEFGETPEETLIRELQEEIDVTPKILFPFPIIKHQIWEKKNYRVQVNLLCYVVDIGTQTITPDGRETLDFNWFEYSQIQTLKSLPLTIDFIKEAHKIHIEHLN